MTVTVLSGLGAGHVPLVASVNGAQTESSVVVSCDNAALCPWWTCGLSLCWEPCRPYASSIRANVSWQTEWKRESGQSGAGHVGAAALVQNKARGSAVGAGFKGDLFVSHPGEEVLLAFGKHFKLRRADQIARPIVRKLYQGLCEEAVAIAADFESEVRRHLIAPGCSYRGA